MPEPRVLIRRSRRTDFTAAMSLLAANGISIPPPDRATLRRFRYLVADLGADLYLAVVDGTLAGLVHVTYARELTVGQRAGIELLLVAEPSRRHGIGTALLKFAQRRARNRGCMALRCVLPPDHSAAGRFLEKGGFHARGNWFAQDLSVAHDLG